MRDPKTLAAGAEAFLGKPGSVTEVVALAAGHSNGTYLLKGLDIVLRTPPEGKGLLPPYDMRRQHDVLSEVITAAPAVPVPRVYGVCTDPALIGVPFYLCEHMAGEGFEYAAPEWLAQATPEFRHRLCEQWVTAVASVHRAGLLPSLGPARAPEETYGAWRERAYWNAQLSEAHATDGYALAGIFDAVAARGYVRSGPSTTVHGDPKIANTLWQEGRLTALLDWEMAHNGEPLSDLGWILHWFPADISVTDIPLPSYDYFALPGMFSRDEVIATWESVTGRSARGVETYEIAATAQLATIIHHGAVAYASGDLDDARMAPFGQVAALMRERAQHMLCGLAPATRRGER
jgi:aminoglycoside phosphotransferase (APT) family kinase protein